MVEMLVGSLEPRHSAQWAQILDTLTRTIEVVQGTRQSDDKATKRRTAKCKGKRK